MALKDYYKKAVYEYGYDCGWLDRNASPTERPRRNTDSDIYYNDEEDYYICADYYGEFVGAVEDWREEDIKFLSVLGFEPSDFEQE